MRFIIIPVAVAALMFATHVCGQTDGGGAPAPELAKLATTVAQWRAMPPFRATVEWKIWYLTGVLEKSVATARADGTPGLRKKVLRPHASGARVEYSETQTFLAAGRKYRIREVGDASMPESAFEAAYDGKQFQFHQMAGSELQYSKRERRDRLRVFLPVEQLSPLEFVGPADSQHAQSTLAWPDIFDEKVMQRRLARGVVGSVDTPAGKRRFVAFDVSGKSEAAPLVYRVFSDRPDGQPTEVDGMDRKGSTWTVTKFEYAKPANCDRWIPVGEESLYYDGDGRVGSSMTAKTTKIEVGPKLAEDAFTIDFVSANTVIDLDTGKAANTSDVESPPSAKKPHPPVSGAGDRPVRAREGEAPQNGE